MLGLVAGALVAVGSVLPWASATVPLVGTVQVTGLDGGDGLIALVAGIVLLVVAGLRFQPRAGVLLRVLAGLLGVVALGVAVFDLVTLGQKASELAAAGLISVGPGLAVLAVGGLVGIVSAFLAGVDRAAVR